MLFKELFFASFDSELAEANGLPVRALNLIIVVLAAIAVALSIRIVGVLLIGALMVIPVISAMQFGKGFRTTLLVSVFFSLLSVVFGLFASYYFNLASGGAIVLIALVIFLASLFLGKRG